VNFKNVLFLAIMSVSGAACADTVGGADKLKTASVPYTKTHKELAKEVAATLSYTPNRLPGDTSAEPYKKFEVLYAP